MSVAGHGQEHVNALMHGFDGTLQIDERNGTGRGFPMGRKKLMYWTIITLPGHDDMTIVNIP